jgi:hypothetical protein
MADMKIDLAGSGKAGALMKGSPHTESHARIFGIFLAALLTACLVLNVASPSTRICQQSERDLGTTDTGSISASTRGIAALGGGSHVEPVGMIRSKECAMNQGGEAPGY